MSQGEVQREVHREVHRGSVEAAGGANRLAYIFLVLLVGSAAYMAGTLNPRTFTIDPLPVSTSSNEPSAWATPEPAPTTPEVDLLREQLATAKVAEQELRTMVIRLRAESARSGHDASTGDPPASPRGATQTIPHRIHTTRPIPQIARVEAADQAVAAALERKDAEGLLHLCGDLLSFGDAGYDRLVALFSQLTERDENASAYEVWQEIGESYLGVALRILSEHDEEVLRFCLYLVERSPDSLPETLRGFREEFPRLAPLLLAFHADRNLELLLDTVAVLRSYYLEGDLSNNSAEDAIAALAHIHLEESTDVLLALIERASPDTLLVIVQAIGVQGNPRALPALESLKAQFTEPAKLVQRLDLAISKLARD